MDIAVVNENALDNGLDRRVLADSASSLYNAAVRGDRTLGPSPSLGWVNAVAVINAHHLSSSESSIQVSVRNLADMTRQARLRGDGEDTTTLFDALPLNYQIAWEAVARFLAWAVQAPEAADGGHVAGEDHFYDWSQSQLATRSKS